MYKQVKNVKYANLCSAFKPVRLRETQGNWVKCWIKGLRSVLPEPQRTASACFPADWPSPAHSNSSPETNCIETQRNRNRKVIKHTFALILTQKCVCLLLCAWVRKCVYTTSPAGCQRLLLLAPLCWDVSA